MYNLYKPETREFQVGESDNPEANAQAIRDWFMKRHESIRALLSNHVGPETWDRIARNKKRGFDALLEVAPGNFNREDIKYARSRALPDNMAASVNARWTGNMKWDKGFFKDGNSCLFGDAAKNLHAMVNQGVSMIGFYDENQAGVGRLFVRHTGGYSEYSGTTVPVGFYAFEGVGSLGEMGYMPHQSGGDILQQLTDLPHKVVLSSNVTWVGRTRPTEEQRDALAREPANYLNFKAMRGTDAGVPPDFGCPRCNESIPALHSRVFVPEPDEGKADRVTEARRLFDEAEANYLTEDRNPDYTASGNKTAPYERRLRAAAERYHETKATLTSLDNGKLIPICLECHYDELLRA